MTTLHQMFVAVIPPREVIDAIDKLPTRAQRGVRYTRRSQWHITVEFIGAADPAVAAHALDRLVCPAPEVHLGPQVSLMGPRVVIVPASGLEQLAAATAAAFQGVGEPQADREFVGHLTLARLKGAPLRDPSTVSVLGSSIDESFRATTVALIEIEQTSEGALHTVVGERALLG